MDYDRHIAYSRKLGRRVPSTVLPSGHLATWISTQTESGSHLLGMHGPSAEADAAGQLQNEQDWYEYEFMLEMVEDEDSHLQSRLNQA